MTGVLVAVAVLQLAAIAFLVVILRRQGDGPAVDLSPLQAKLDVVEKSQEKAERMVREEMAKNREESSLNSRQAREDSAASAKALREEVGAGLKNFSDSLVKNMTEIAALQKNQLSAFSEQLAKLIQTNDQKMAAVRETVEQRLGALQAENVKKLDRMREESATSAKRQREELAATLKGFNDSILKGMAQAAEAQKGQMEAFAAQIGKLAESNEKRLEALRSVVDGRLKQIQENNSMQLDQMRSTVDEKLQGTLEKRLGESFKLVSDRLEQVHKGLGEMQVLATGVGDLKKVLSNVKTRGNLGEIQLGALLEQILTPEQFGRNVRTKDESGVAVEFAIKLPGRGDDSGEVIWLPVDAKFPTEDYQRLVEAQDKGDSEAAGEAGKALAARIRSCARDISEKYLNPPATTDFGILFLPTEGLYAEVVRRPELLEAIQREFRVNIAGPSTFAAMLNALRVGFQTLAIQKRSGEVWKILGSVKTEFGKFSTVLEGVKKKLDQASNTMDDAARRSRAIEKKLRKVEELPAPGSNALLPLSSDGEIEDLQE